MAAPQSQLHVGTVRVMVTRKAIKNIHLRVRPPHGEVCVSAPLHVSERLIIGFVEARLEWIRHHQKQIAARPKPTAPSYATGAIHLLFGTPYSLTFSSDPLTRPQGLVQGAQFHIYVSPATTADAQRQQALETAYRHQLVSAAQPMFEYWQSRMGVAANEWRIRKMRTRWGTCNTQAKRVWLSLMLAQQPLDCVEYVVVHELVHLLERGHTARFYRFMDQFLPDWRARQRRLNHGT